MEKVVSEASSVIIVQKTFAEQINEWFLCNGNTDLKQQRECMVMVNINLQTFLIVSGSKRNVKLQPGR